MKKCNRLISHLAFPIDYLIISINRPTTNSKHFKIEFIKQKFSEELKDFSVFVINNDQNFVFVY